MHWMLAHLIGDYLLQNDWMARNKKSNSWICLCHVLTYLVPFLCVGLSWWQLLMIGGQHFVQDRTHFVLWVMRVTGKTDFARAPMAPWSIIVTDNILHILFIAAMVALSG